jgi:hypothetical protein
MLCTSQLANCFGDVVYLKDFAGYGEDNPVPFQEFNDLLDKVAEDLYTHDLTSPGFTSGRLAYDTPFYNGGGRGSDLPEGIFPANQQVCIEGLGCSGRSNINYFAQGMWSAAAGESLEIALEIAEAWKLQYGETNPEDALYWVEYGYNYYLNWLEQQEQQEGN